MNELISIIMPAYNSEKYIADSIESVICQTYPFWELIIIDDNSSDKTVSIINKYLSADKRIVIYKNEINKGVSFSRNFGMSKAKGEWVAFLDSDDIWDTQKLTNQINYAITMNVSFVFSGVIYIDVSNNILNHYLSIPKNVCYSDLLKQNVIPCSSVLIKYSLICNYSFESGNIHEDYCMWLRILRNEKYAHGINEPLLKYRMHVDSKSGNKLASLIMSFNTYIKVCDNTLYAFGYLLSNIYRNTIKYITIRRGKHVTTGSPGRNHEPE